MKKRRFVASFAVLAFSGLATAATTIVTGANIADYTGASSITIAAGDTLQFSGITSAFTLSAPISGGGTLLLDGCTGAATLAGDNASFSGTLLVTNSTMVTVGHAHALGSASVHILTDCSITRTFLYNATGEFLNDITLDTKSIQAGSSAYAFRYSVATGHTVTNTGTLTFVQPASQTPRIEVGTTSGDDQKGRLVLAGTLNKPNGYGYLYFYAPVTLAKTFTGSGLTGGAAFFLNSGCDAILEKDVSDLITGSLHTAKGTLRFAAEDCLTARTLTVGSAASPQQTVDLDGYDQHFLTVQSPLGNAANVAKTASKVYTSSAPATMTITHNFSHNDSSNTGWGRLSGHLSFAFDSDGASGTYCGINTYGTVVNDTDGSITALNGTLHLGDNMNFTALSALVVTNSGSIALATGAFPATCDVYLSGTGKLILSNNISLLVNRVFYKVGDAFVQADAGSYTAGEDGVAAFVGGEGTLTALSSPSVTVTDYHWTSTGDTSLALAANWQENAAPDLAAGTAYLHFNAGAAAAEAASDVEVYGLDFTRGTDFALGGAGYTASVGPGGVTVANTDGAAAHAVTIAPRLNLAEQAPWIVGGNSSLALAGGISSVMNGAVLTISGGETASGGNQVTFAGYSSASAMAVEVTNVERVVVASDTALPSQGLVMYDSYPDFSSVTSNGAPVTILDIAHNTYSPTDPGAVVFWSNGVFRQTGLFTLRSRSADSGHRSWIHVTGGEVQFLGGLELVAARQIFNLYNESKMRVAGTVRDAALGFDIRGMNIASNEVRSSAVLESTVAMYMGRVTFVCEAENVLTRCNPDKTSPSLSLGIQANGHSSGVMTVLDLNGYDQEINTLNGPTYEKMGLPAGAHALVKSATPATLTAQHATSDALMLKFSGAVNFTFDGVAVKGGGATLTLSNVVSDTTGDLLVKNGTLVFDYGAGWGGSSNVTVGAGALLKVTAAGAPTAFAPVAPGRQLSRVNLKLETDGENCGQLDLGGNVAVRSLRIGDTFMPPGDYGSTASGVANPNDSHFTGTGMLHVRRASFAEGFKLIVR